MVVRPIPSEASYEVSEMLKKAVRLLEKAEKLEMVEHDGKKVPHFAADGKGSKDEKKKGEGHEAKIISCLKRKGGAASLDDCAKECGVSKAECKKVIDKMNNVKISPHGDVVLMDGLQKGKGMGICPSCGERKMDMEKGMCMSTSSKAMKAGCTPAHRKQNEKLKKGEHHYLQSYGTKPEHAQFMIGTGGQTYNSFYYTNQSLLDSDDVANKGASSHSVDLTALQPNMNPHENPVRGHLTEG